MKRAEISYITQVFRKCNTFSVFLKDPTTKEGYRWVKTIRPSSRKADKGKHDYKALEKFCKQNQLNFSNNMIEKVYTEGYKCD